MKISKYELEAGSKIYKPKAPFCSRVLKSFSLTAHDGPDEVAHIVLDLHGSDLRYIEGQSIGISTPGQRPDGKPHKLRLYSIASSRQGENGFGLNLSLCVRRLVETDSQSKIIYRGTASNYLCNLHSGDSVYITGPVGKAFALPKDSSLNLILFATGTGIAPFRSFLNFIYNERPGEKGWQGKMVLFMGAKSKAELLYLNAVNNDLSRYAQQGLSIYTTCSREEKNSQGERLYVQHKLLMHAEEIFPLIKDGRCAIYLCGVMGMSKGIESSLEEICLRQSKGQALKWPELKADLQSQGKWNVEEY